MRNTITAVLFTGGFFVAFAGCTYSVIWPIIGLAMMVSTFGIVRWSWLDQPQPAVPRTRPPLNLKQAFGLLAIALMVVGGLALPAGLLLHYGKGAVVGVIMICLGIALKIVQTEMSSSSNTVQAKKPVLLNEDHPRWSDHSRGH